LKNRFLYDCFCILSSRATLALCFKTGSIAANVSRLPKLPHSRHDAARAKRVDGDGGFKAAIWGGAFSARKTCVSGCKYERYLSVCFPPPSFFFVFHGARFLERMYALLSLTIW
jgi:hypothetical protein